MRYVVIVTDYANNAIHSTHKSEASAQRAAMALRCQGRNVRVVTYVR